ncbi:MAG: hypothetical protein U0V87_05110 [Acidobacteriota bacterium]
MTGTRSAGGELARCSWNASICIERERTIRLVNAPDADQPERLLTYTDFDRSCAIDVPQITISNLDITCTYSTIVTAG